MSVAEWEVIVMTKTELAKAMTQANGGPLIKLSRIAEMVGDSNSHRVKQKYLLGLERINGRYFIPEVAERLKEKAVV